MASFTTFLIVYLFGGFTFIPLLIALAIYLTTQPVSSEATPALATDTPVATEKQRAGSLPKNDYSYDGLVLPGDDVKTLESVRREHAQEKAGKSGSGPRKHRGDRAEDFATAGYFAVHRKYVSMGVNSKPVEPGSVGPTPVAPPSPSVYQTFFRNMLPKKNGNNAVEVSNAASPRPKNARNMFYVVLRHGHLILFDDDQQVDVRHVIKLADHDVRISSGGGSTPEGELFIKRNAIHLSPRNLQRAKAHNAPTPQPWFFFCENCSEKEDFYFSLLRSQEDAPQPHEIDVRHLTALMERLHASEEAAEMRWLNALVGRLFLGVYKTSDVLNFVQSKIVTKLSRMPRPNFVASLVVQRVDIGETTPQITSPRLKSLTAEGECIVEADVRYTGRFEVDVAAVLRVSTPIGQQEVKTSLAIVLTQLEGHVLFKIKAPPSNRIWFSFRHMPKIEMEVRPIIMARQLTWPVFIQLIEGKIKEAIAESIVLPFWDDTPFFSTENKACRGGVWEDKSDKAHDGTAIRTGLSMPASGADAKTATSSGVSNDVPSGEENASPALLRLRRLSKANSSPTTATMSSTSVNSLESNSSERGRSSSLKKTSKKNRSSSDINDPNREASPPKLPTRPSTLSATSDHTAEAGSHPTLPLKNGQSNSNAMSWLSSGTLRSRASSLARSEAGTPTNDDLDATPRQNERPQSSRNDNENTDPFFTSGNSTAHNTSSSRLGGEGNNTTKSPAEQAARAATFAASSASAASLHRKKSIERAATVATTPDGDHNAKTSAVLAAAMTGAAQSAKRWGINALQRRATAVAERKAKAELEHRKGLAELDLTKPMGGGLPLPPLGEPLPLPSQLVPKADTPAATGSPVSEKKIKRKQVQPHAQPSTARQQSTVGSTHDPSISNESVGRRRQNTGGSSAWGSVPDLEPPQDLLVVAAPIDSDPEDEEDDSGLEDALCHGQDTNSSNSVHGSSAAESRSDSQPSQSENPGASSHSLKSEASGRESPVADEHDDGDDEQWGELAESVISAFLEGDDGQAKDRGHHQSQEESLISLDVGDEAVPEGAQRH
ncbi:ph domain-containing protein [Ophiostoma piceae UAMH 11346]|uniref:Ph domain-containing protein n=1 Tax=Ophiostoma piceae (strain UAMH 11346) TaxID=1262450 RepID=S3BVL6_OPHP1|nr:ph domain-containing protein [Ophiostoma piceae UAMH 11346]